MFLRVYEYERIRRGGRWFRPGAYGIPQLDGWAGWLVFFPSNGEPPIATARETTQPTLAGLTGWASALTPVYLAGALERALTLATDGFVFAQLRRAEYDALAEAEQLETSAAIERTAAEVDEAAAGIAREEAQRLRQERRTPETSLVDTEAAVEHETEVQHGALRMARAEAADAERRTRIAKTKARRSPRKRSEKKK